jgi:hypothetical protein
MSEDRKSVAFAVMSVVLMTVGFSEATSTTLSKQKAGQATSYETSKSSPAIDTLIYVNKAYSFRFALPASWKGYSIVVKEWADGKGPLILIRHPLWTEANPRQDIPVMVITLSQWNLIQQGKLSVSAAPIGPDELGRNAKYVFALPPRYNFAYLTGYEEVAEILSHHPLTAF